MLKAKIKSIGKVKEPWLEEALREYTKRLSRAVQIEWILASSERELESWGREEPDTLCLDPSGRLMTSELFSSYLFHVWEKGGSKLTLMIGGAEGFSSTFREEKESQGKLISLSPMTLTHQMTRLILLEQLYRAVEIHKGSSYHK